MKYFLIAGEPSGDMHAARLIRALKDADAGAEFRYYGGDAMRAEATGMVAHYRELAIMGFFEVLVHLRTIARRFKETMLAIEAFAPDVLILVDFGGFNLRVAKLAKERGVRVFYYIVPKVWAWHEGRVKNLKRYVDALFVIFPFEVPYFLRHGLRVYYEGNPSVDTVAECGGMRDRSLMETVLRDDRRPVVALLPGSRRMEIRYNLPPMLRVVERFPQYRFVLCAADSIDDSTLDRYIPKGTPLTVVRGATLAALRLAEGAVVTSGTATLEAALLRTPEVVVYRGPWSSMLLMKLLIRVKWISLVNLILGYGCVKELKQHEYTVDALERELRNVLPGGALHDQQQAEFGKLRNMLGQAGVAERVARRMVSLLMEDARK